VGHIEAVFLVEERPKNEREILKCITAMILGDTAFAQHAYFDAMDHYRKANAHAQKAMSEEFSWQTAYRIAKTNERLDRKAEALKGYKETIDSIDGLRKALPLSICQPDFFKDKRHVFESLLNLLYELQLKNPGKGNDEEALYYMEKYRAGFQYQALVERNVNLVTNQDGAFEKERGAIKKQISAIMSKLRESGLTSKLENDRALELEKAEEQYRGLFIRRAKKIKGFIGTNDSQPILLDQVQQKLPDKPIGLLEYFLGEEHSFALFISKQELRLAKLTDKGKIREAVENYLKYLQLRETKDFRGSPGSQRLLDLLVGPFLDELSRGIEKIVIIPDDHLHYLPFECLSGLADRSRERKTGPHFLVENLEISYAPSISWWLATTDYAFSYGGLNRLLAIGYSNEHPARSLNADVYFRLPSLRFVRQEIKAISSLFKDAKPVALLDEEAGEEELYSEDLADFDIIHFATHGIFDNERWWRSFLILEQNPGLEDDGFLSPLEILDLEFNAKLVVLSACQTAKGKLYEGEGILGISQAFLLAGAKSIIASLWNVNDESSVQIFKSFYRTLIRGESIAQALRLAKLEMINSRFRHPFYWAGFILMENGDNYKNHGQN
jgi:CHAT domain-containing protein